LIKKLAVSFLSLSSFLSSAQSAFDGAYATAEFGGALAYANQSISNAFNLNIPSLEFSSTAPYQNNSSMNRPAATGTLLLGYGYSYQRWYMGGELGVSAGYYEMSSNANTGLDRFVQTGSLLTVSSAEATQTQVGLSPIQFSLFLRPGFLITPQSLLSVRVGTSFATASLYSNLYGVKVLSDSGVPQFLLPLQVQGKKSQHVAALQLGTGLEQAVSEHIKIRMDYLFSYYGKLRFQNSGGNFNSISELKSDFILNGVSYQSVSINTQSILLGLSYGFS
jgi:opacity protein-like surface antigen